MTRARELSAKKLRRQLFIAPRAQGRMMYRAMVRVVSAATANTLLGLAFVWAAGMSPVTAAITALAVVIVVAIPLTLIDAARVSNEVLGPFVRVQGAIRQIAYGDEISRVAIRDDDMWQEWMQEFNVLIDRIQQLGSSEQADASSSHVTPQQEVT